MGAIDYSLRPSATEQLRRKLALCKTADEVLRMTLKLGREVPDASRATHRKWSRLAQRRIEQLATLSAPRPLIWTPPAPAPKKDEPLIVVP